VSSFPVFSKYGNFEKKSLVYQLFPLFGIDTDPERSDPGWHALDADADPIRQSDADPSRPGSAALQKYFIVF
jgi:hypothetical protein